MDNIQKKVFELLELLINICEKWDIKYYLVCGSALGAVKYQGFIPWDDDIDVAMLRGDYERFLKVAPKELPDWCFLQNHMTDPAYPRASSKLRNSNTTFIEQGVEKLSMNHGVYVDVFPLDGYPERKLQQIGFEIRKKINLWKIFCALSDSPELKVRIRNKLFRILGYHKKTANTIKQLEKLYAHYPPSASAIWCNHGNSISPKEYAPRWHYGEGVWMLFEGRRVRIPAQYDAYFTQKYGEWRKDPPEESRSSHHHYLVRDAAKPYTFYLEEKLHDEFCGSSR